MNFYSRRRIVGRWGVPFAFVALGAAIMGVCGCGLGGGSPERPRFVAVLIDETDSFTKDWDAMIRAVGLVANRLGPGAGMVVIGVDDQGFQPDDIRIDVRFLDPSPLKSRIDARRLAQEIGALKRRTPKRPVTDVLGAIRHAAYFVNRYPHVDPVVVAFSDMRQTPRMPTAADATGLSFPAGTTVNCFFVDATGWQDWRKTVQNWQELLTKAGASISAESFHQKAETTVELNRMFPRAY